MKVLAIPDLHCPYQHPKAFEFVKKIADDFNPDRVVCLGDEIDGYSWSHFKHDPDAYSAEEEHKLAVEALQPFYKRFPKVSVCHSNHTVRARKAMDSVGVPTQWGKTPKEALKAPKGWNWEPRFEIDGVYYFHGDGFGRDGWKKAMIELGASCVMGHVHNWGGVNWIHTFLGRRFGLGAGCLINPNAVAFRYAYTKGIARPALGCATVTDGVDPQFIVL